MSVDTSTSLFSEYVAALLARADLARFLTEDVVWTTVETGERITGPRAVADHIAALHTQVFDAHPEVRALGVNGDGDHAFFEADFVGTHTGTFGDLPATGRPVRVPYCVVYDLTGAGISALRFHLSFATLTAQLRG
ncbi:ester cyclase [Kineococcus sp. SYSU DK003]|uniref:ester cyclase n=1 Tax=Kineococcus sp. SYSU DK003 TaxID=3383124 RepID=UPI003D7DC347